MMMTFYNNTGKPIAYCEDMQTIYLFTGKPVGYFTGDAVYGFNGCYLGYFEYGWIRDRLGQCVFFTEQASGGPLMPMMLKEPLKNVKQLQPRKDTRQPVPSKMPKSSTWSFLSNEGFFEQ